MTLKIGSMYNTGLYTVYVVNNDWAIEDIIYISV